jgi:hypothetical protein
MKHANDNKSVSSLTIIAALTIKAFSYKNYRGKEVHVPVNEYIYVDIVSGIALIGHDHVDIGADEYCSIQN